MPDTRPSRATVLPRDDQLLDVAGGRAREQQIERIEVGTQAVRVERVPVEQQDIGRCARRCSVPPSSLLVTERRPLTSTAFEDRGAIDFDVESRPPPCSRSASRISRSASSSSSSVAPSRPSATRQPRLIISASGAMPERRCRFDDVLTEMVTRRSASSSSSSGRAQAQCASVSALAQEADLVEIADDAARGNSRRPIRAGSASPAGACGCGGRCAAEASATACSSSGVHHCTAAGPYCTSKVSLAQADATASTSAICSFDRQWRADEAPLDLGARIRRQRRENRLGRTVDQRIAIAQRRREADAHADVARGARDLLRLGDVVGQALRAGVVHHHAAGAAERGARERHGGRQIRIDRGQQRQPVQPDFQRLAGGAERARARRARVVVRVGERRQGEQRFGAPAAGVDRRDALAVDADRMIADGGRVGRRQDVRAVELAHLR